MEKDINPLAYGHSCEQQILRQNMTVSMTSRRKSYIVNIASGGKDEQQQEYGSSGHPTHGPTHVYKW